MGSKPCSAEEARLAEQPSVCGAFFFFFALPFRAVWYVTPLFRPLIYFFESCSHVLSPPARAPYFAAVLCPVSLLCFLCSHRVVRPILAVVLCLCCVLQRRGDGVHWNRPRDEGQVPEEQGEAAAAQGKSLTS